MKCPGCRHENRNGAKFCEECGTKIEIICPNCGIKIGFARKFCTSCGQSLLLSSAPPASPDFSLMEKFKTIQRFLPRGLIEKILSQKSKMEGERKQVTVMFCDMAGFTRLSNRLGPEEAYSTMDQVYEILIQKVRDYGGSVNEMTGDGIMALFGAPIAMEDAPQRAIRAAMAIHREMVRFSHKQQTSGKDVPQLKMRIGIHKGPVVVGELGNDSRVEFKAVGDTVNLASRIENLAEPGTTYVSEEIYKVTEGMFRFEALGEKEIKGIEEPMRVFRLIAPSTRKTRFDVSAERGLTAFVGRQQELELMLDALERAKSGRGQALSIMSSAGMGKSRLVYEFRKAIAGEDVTLLEGRCLSYSKGINYYPHIDMLKSNFNIAENDEDDAIRRKVKKGLSVLGIDEAQVLPYLLELLSVKESGIDKIPLTPEARSERFVEILKLIILKGSEIRPLIAAFEDLHWVDRASEEVFKALLDGIRNERVLFIFTYRPEFVNTWGGRSLHNQLILNRLSNRDSLEMVSYVVGKRAIDKDLEDLILEKTEGVPLFIEEFVKSLQELKIIDYKDNSYRLTRDIGDSVIPSTIHDVIMSRVDSLHDDTKEVLQTGSVIEREFGYDLIRQVTGLPEKELLTHLSVLKDAELLYERGIYPDTIYVFRHALTQEVVYDSILTRRRKLIHEKIGQAIETLHGDNLDPYLGVLADHFIKSENYEKGADYLGRLGGRTLKTASLSDTITYARKRMECLEKLPKTDEIEKKIIDVRTALGGYYTQMTYHVEAKEVVDPIIDLAAKHGHMRQLSQIYSIVASYYHWVEEDFPKAFRHFEQGLRISNEINDIVSLAFGNLNLGHALAMNCSFDKASDCFQKAFSINMEANNIWGVMAQKAFLIAYKTSLSYYIHGYQGNIDKGFEVSREALAMADDLADIFSKARAYTTHGVSCHCKGLFQEAIAHLNKGVAFCEATNYYSWNATAQLCLGDTYFELGEYPKAITHYERAASLWERNRIAPSIRNLNKICVARARVMNDEKEVNLDSLYDYVNRNKIKTHAGYMLRQIGEILLNIDDRHLAEAGYWIGRAIEADQRNGMAFNLGRDYALYAELFRRKKDIPKAREYLGKTIELFDRCGVDGWIRGAERDMGALDRAS